MQEYPPKNSGSRNPDFLKEDLQTIGKHQVLTVLAVLAGAWILDPAPIGWLIGCLAGFSDNGLFLYGIYKGMHKEPHQAARYMHRMMAVRILCLLVFTLLALKARWNPGKVLISYLIFYVTMLIRMARTGVRSPGNPPKE
jgi:hypothetical protein